MGTEKLAVNMEVGLTNGNNPSQIRFSIAEGLTCDEIQKTLKIDGKRGVKAAWSKFYNVCSEVQKEDHKFLHWLNTIVSNCKAFIQGTYHGIAKKYLLFNLVEFEWRFNHRYYGKSILSAALRMVLHTKCYDG